MDCKITENYLKEYARLCDKNSTCKNCPLNADKEIMFGYDECFSFTKYNPDRAIAIVQKWSDEHPRQTYKDVFLKAFPNAKLDDGTPRTCVEAVFGTDGCASSLSCSEHWNEEYKENK